MSRLEVVRVLCSPVTNVPTETVGYGRTPKNSSFHNCSSQEGLPQLTQFLALLALDAFASMLHAAAHVHVPSWLAHGLLAGS